MDWCCKMCGLPLFMDDEEALKTIENGMMLLCESCALDIEYWRNE